LTGPDPLTPDHEVKGEVESKKEDNAEAIKQLEKEIKDLQKERDSYFDGTQQAEYTRDVLFEFNDAIHYPYLATNAIQYMQMVE